MYNFNLYIYIFAYHILVATILVLAVSNFEICTTKGNDYDNKRLHVVTVQGQKWRSFVSQFKLLKDDNYVILLPYGKKSGVNTEKWTSRRAPTTFTSWMLNLKYITWRKQRL